MRFDYMPILKGKEGEYAALAELAPSVRARIAPLIEVPNVPFDYVNERPVRTLENHVQGITAKLLSCWGAAQSIYLDYHTHTEQANIEDGTPAIQLILEQARAAGLMLVPVVHTDTPEACTAAVAEHVAITRLGVCIRLRVADFDEEVDLEDQLRRIGDQVGVSRADADVILDLGEIQSDVQRSLLLVRALMMALPEPDRWRRVAVAASSFPEDLRDANPGSVTEWPRHEWALWTALQRRPERLARRDLVFADYGITHPDLKELDPRAIRMSASIRYTGKEDWVIVKGRNVRQFGYEQYHALCQTLVKHPSYPGPTFSWGDRFIAETAEGRSGPGNATTWRKVGTNHHVTQVVHQLSSRGAS